MICLELTPPAFGNKEPGATEELFTVLHNLGHKRIFKNSSDVFSLEILSTRAQGIRYIVRLASSIETVFRHTISTYLPEIQIKEVNDVLTERDISTARIVEFEQAKHFAYPLKSHSSLGGSDPMSYLTGAMTMLADNELIIFQIVLAPARVREVSSMTRKIMSNEDLLADLHKSHFSFLNSAIRLINKLSFSLTDLATSTYHGASQESYMFSQQDAHQKHQAMMGLKPARILTSFEQELVESIHAKLNQSMFRANIRVLVLSNNKQVVNERVKGLQSALASFSMPNYQALQIRKSLVFLNKRKLSVFSSRLPSLLNKYSELLSVSEIADMYHFPNAQTNKTENVLKSLSRNLPAPIFLKDSTKLDVLLGMNHYHGSKTPIGLTSADRERHIYIIGGTGNGKTTMLLYGIVQDINNGKGVAVIDPHGDLANTILRHIPQERINDVIYLNPDDCQAPFFCNTLSELSA